MTYTEEEIDNIPKFSEILNGQNIDAYGYNCYDGDSFKCIITLPGTTPQSPVHKIKITCRLYGIDTPEKRTKNTNEKRMALLARDALCKKILNKNIKITIDGTDKYGRVLAKIPEVEEYMLENNYGYRYTGGTKAKPTYHDDNSFTINGVKYVMPESPP